MYQGSSPDHDASSSCSTASPGGDSPARGSQPPPLDSLSSASSMDSINQDPDSSASDSFVPTVTAISTSPDLRWMVQPTVITTTTTHSPSRGGARAKARSKEHTAGKKGRKDQPSKEEEERRKIRRERNKIAAAKCRNRRRELTDTLQAETDTLEEEKAALQTEIAELIKEKERLEQVLASHEPGCALHPNEEHRDDVVNDAAAEMDDELEEDKDEDDDGDDDVSPMQQDPPASSPPTPLLSMWPESESLSEGTSSSSSSMSLLLVGPPLAPLAPQDLDPPPCTAAAILGNSDILLCSSAEEEEEEEAQEEAQGEEEGVEPLEDLKVDDLDDLVPSLEMTAPEEEGGAASVAASVPDIDLGGAFGLPDWETLYRSVAQDLEALGTPLVSSSPTCGGDGYRSVFSFSGPEIDSLQAEDDCLALRGLAGGGSGAAEFTKDSLNSPTLLAL
ncbi:unnamed protein product [Lota lota]